MAEQTHNTDMSDEPDRQDLADRVDQLESTISKMLPGRRDALKLGGAALFGGAAMSGAASAQPGDQDGEAGVIGTDNNPVDIEASDIEVDDLVVNGTATGPFDGGDASFQKLAADEFSLNSGAPFEFHRAFTGATSGARTFEIYDLQEPNEGRTVVMRAELVAAAKNNFEDGFYTEQIAFHKGSDQLTSSEINGGGDIDTTNTGASFSSGKINFTFDSGNMNFGDFYLIIRGIET